MKVLNAINNKNNWHLISYVGSRGDLEPAVRCAEFLMQGG